MAAANSRIPTNRRSSRRVSSWFHRPADAGSSGSATTAIHPPRHSGSPFGVNRGRRGPEAGGLPYGEPERTPAHRELSETHPSGAVTTSVGQRGNGIRRAASIALSEREVEVHRLVAREQTNPSTAHALGISPKTVERHVTHIYIGRCVLPSRGGHPRPGERAHVATAMEPPVAGHPKCVISPLAGARPSGRASDGAACGTLPG